MNELTIFSINGFFLSLRMQGIVRYALEITKALDKVLCGSETFTVELVVPNYVDVPMDLENIEIVHIGSKRGIMWEQIDFASYLRKNKRNVPINLCNVAPLCAQAGITTIHDIMYKVNPSHYTTLRNRISRLWHIFQYRVIARRELLILTDSAYSRDEINKYYPCTESKIALTSCAWQHVKDFCENEDWENDYKELIPGKYYFSMATLSKNKNGRWIIETAKRNPQDIFAIAGMPYEAEYAEIPSNVVLLGFISDDDACSLIKNCKAFIFPSLYEGFGLPPLEALALGATVISSNATSLPEVLGKSVHYVSPLSFDVDINALMEEAIEDCTEVLSRLSWKQSALVLTACMGDICEELRSNEP